MINRTPSALFFFFLNKCYSQHRNICPVRHWMMWEFGRSSWGFIWPFVAHKMSLCVVFYTGQGAKATQSRELPRDPDAWRLVTRETSEALQKCWFSLLGNLLSCHVVSMKYLFHFHSWPLKRSWFSPWYYKQQEQKAEQENLVAWNLTPTIKLIQIQKLIVLIFIETLARF